MSDGTDGTITNIIITSTWSDYNTVVITRVFTAKDFIFADGTTGNLLNVSSGSGAPARKRFT